MYWGHGMNGWGMLAMTVSTLVFLGLLVVGVVFLGRQLGAGQAFAAVPTPADPKEILAARYARGEIDDTEYQRRLNILQGDLPAG